jgi:hypothetical protein
MAITDNAIMTTKPRTVKVLIFTVTESWANTLFVWSNVLLVFGAAAVLFGTIGAFSMGAAKEQFSNERIKANEAATARANADAENAKQGAAEANARALESQLALEKYKAPRSLSSEQQARITAKMKGFAGVPFDFVIQADSEPIGLMEQIGTALKAAGLVWEPWHNGVVFRPPGLPQTGITAASGLIIQIDNSKAPQWGAAVIALKDALLAEGIAADARGITDGTETPNAIHIYIGRKPQ